MSLISVVQGESPEGSPSPKSVYRCDVDGCSAAFGKPVRLKWHIAAIHSGERPYPCTFPGCDKAFTRPFHLTRHEAKSHGPKQLGSAEQYSCTVDSCADVFPNKQNRDRHVQRIHEKRQFVCNICQKRFHKHHQLTSHEYVHSGQLPYPCPVEDCEKAFPTKQKLDRHMKTHQGYKCPIEGCSELFEKWSQVRQHKAAAHRRLFRCDICKKDFQRKAVLESHLETHKEERKGVECKDCKSILISEKALREHAKRCAAKKSELICDYPGCGKVFLRKPNFEKHKALHPNLDSVASETMEVEPD